MNKSYSKTYRTSEAAQMIGIHPNTVRLYEEMQLIPPAKRQENGYRIFTDYHIEQMRLARSIFKVEVMQSGLRKMAIDIIKTSAARNFDGAITLTNAYIEKLETERRNAEEAIQSVKQILSGCDMDFPSENSDIISVCDSLITSLTAAHGNSKDVLCRLIYMKKNFSNPPL